MFRDGLESVLFLTATFLLDPLGTIIGAVVGSTIVLVLTVLIREIYRLDISKFFKYTSVLLIVFAMGLVGFGVHELIEAGESLGLQLGVWSQHAYDINPPINPDGSYPIFHERGIIGSILKALVGYDDNPE